MKEYINFESEVCGTDYEFDNTHIEDIPKDKFIEEGFTKNLTINKDEVSPNVWRRYKVLNKNNFTCSYCGRRADRYFKLVSKTKGKYFYVYFMIENKTRKVFTVDHKIPKSFKGDKKLLAIIGNYQTLCRACNMLKANKIQPNPEIKKQDVILEKESIVAKWTRIKAHLVAIIHEIF